VLYEYIIFFALAFIVSFSSTPIAKKIAFSVGAVDVRMMQGEYIKSLLPDLAVWPYLPAFWFLCCSEF